MTFSFKPQEAAVTCFPCSCVALRISAGVGCVSLRVAGPGAVKPSLPPGVCQAGGWGRPLTCWEALRGRQRRNWDERCNTTLPWTCFPFCVMQNDCNWEYIWNKQALWLSNVSALLFMFMCRLCNSYKLLLHDRLLHLKFSLSNSSSSFIFLTA